ncbi:MAG: hypothetical protein EOP50_00905 [Sphingobacteriales bacterium]|nr:MAG: hypothetical protein EOP50_00905 [Sphingobacteriales bacterium]
MMLTNIGPIASSRIKSDPDVSAYIMRLAARGYTAPAALQEQLYNTIQNMKADGTYDASVEFWLYIGGTAATHALGFKGLFDLTFVGSPSHSANGWTPNGTTQYARTGAIPSVLLANNSYHQWGYIGTTSAFGFDEAIMGAKSGANLEWRFGVRNSSGNATSYQTSGLNSTLVANSDGRGMYVTNRSSALLATVDKNGAQIASVVSSGNSSALPSVELYIGAFNDSGTPFRFTNKQIRGNGFGNGLTPAQRASLAANINALETFLGRNTF